MSYKHDIFISYKRHPETLKWIEAHLLPLLDLHVGLELGRDPNIYVHEIKGQIKAGTVWPVELGEELGASRTLIALWSKPYLSSTWCVEEFSLMLSREKAVGARTLANKYGLVVPIVVHDGENIPSDLGAVQMLDIKAYYNPRMRRDSEKAEALSDVIGTHAQGLAGAIENAPPWQANWPKQAAEQL
ncbi:MAG: toll/interleukin-1 receptor domain-containing protein, partial [Exilibacterium sp.]